MRGKGSVGRNRRSVRSMQGVERLGRVPLRSGGRGVISYREGFGNIGVTGYATSSTGRNLAL